MYSLTHNVNLNNRLITFSIKALNLKKKKYLYDNSKNYQIVYSNSSSFNKKNYDFFYCMSKNKRSVRHIMHLYSIW